MSDPFESVLEQAVNNADWNALSAAQRKCLLEAYEHADDAPTDIPRWYPPNCRVARSKALRPYMRFTDYHWHITDEGRDLVAYVKSRETLPQWRFLVETSKRGVESILQTRNVVGIETLLALGWKEVSESRFKMYARNLSEAYTEVR